MKNLSKILLIIFSILIAGCAKSGIKLFLVDDTDTYPMFGKNSAPEFFIPVDISDSLSLLWENSVYGSFNNSSITYKDSVLFVSDLAGRIHCFDIFTGKQKGYLKTKGAIFSSPLLINHKIIYASCSESDYETELIFYDLFESKELKSVTVEGHVLNQMLLDNNEIIFCTNNGSVHCYNSNGVLQWETKKLNRIYSNPSIVDSKIFILNSAGELICLNRETGKIIYRIYFGNPFYSGITAKGNRLFFGDDRGIFYSINKDDGKLIWKYNTQNRITMNPACDEKNVYIGNLNGDMFSFEIESGMLNWQKNYSGVLNSTPLITNNKLVVPSLLKSFLLVNKQDGNIEKKYELDGRCKLSPVIINTKLVVGYDDGVIRVYEIIK